MGELNKEQLVRSRNYYQTFRLNPIGQKVYKDLIELFDGSCFDENPTTMAYKEGKRDVMLYIQERLNEHAISEDS